MELKKLEKLFTSKTILDNDSIDLRDFYENSILYLKSVKIHLKKTNN